MAEPAPARSGNVDQVAGPNDPAVGRWSPPQPAASGIEEAARKEGAVGKEDAAPQAEKVREIGGRKDGTDPTRYGDWEKNGRCIDF